MKLLSWFFVSIKNILLWLSGSSSEIINGCGKAEERKYIAIGLSILIPTTMGFIVGKYAASTLVSDPIVIYTIAFVWAAIVLIIDILLLAATRPTHWKSISSLTLIIFRLAIAVVLGISISHPITLSIFNDSIAVEINKTKAEERKNIIRLYEEKKQKDESNIDEYNKKKKEIEQKTNEEIAKYKTADMSEYLSKNQTATAPENDSNPYKTQQEKSSSEINDLKTQINAIDATVLDLTEKMAKEIKGNGTTGKPGCGKVCREYGVQINKLRERSTNIESTISEKEGTLKRIHNTISQDIEARVKEDNQRSKDTKSKIDKMRDDHIKVVGDDAEKNKKIFDGLIDKSNSTIKKDYEEHIGIIKEFDENKRGDILSRTVALNKIFEGNGGEFAKFTYHILMVLFVLIDMIPIIGKSLIFTVDDLYAKALLVSERTKYLRLESVYLEHDDISNHKIENLELGADKRKNFNKFEYDRYIKEESAKSTREMQYNLHRTEAEYENKEHILKYRSDTDKIKEFNQILDQVTEDFKTSIEKRHAKLASNKFEKIKEREELLRDKMIDDYYDDQDLLRAEFYTNRKNRYSQSQGD